MPAVGADRRHRQGRRRPRPSTSCAACWRPANATRCRSWSRSPGPRRADAGACRAARPATRRRPPSVLGMKGSTFPARKALDQSRPWVGPAGRPGRRAAGRGRPAPCGAPSPGRRRAGDGGARRAPAPGPLGRLTRNTRRPGRRALETGRSGQASALALTAFIRRDLSPAGLVLVDHALGGGLVDALDGQAQQPRRSRRRRRRSVTAFLLRVFSSERTALLRSAAILVLQVALDLALDVRHWVWGPLGSDARDGGGATAVAGIAHRPSEAAVGARWHRAGHGPWPCGERAAGPLR